MCKCKLPMSRLSKLILWQKKTDGQNDLEIIYQATLRVVKNPQIANTDLSYCEEHRILLF